MTDRAYWEVVWEEALSGVPKVRTLAPFDSEASAARIDKAVAAESNWHPWVLIAAIVAALLNLGLGAVLFGGWALMLGLGAVRAARLRRRLESEEDAAAERQRETLKAFERDVVASLDSGSPLAYQALLRRWHDLRPEALSHVELSLVWNAGRWLLSGRGVSRERIPETRPRRGRGRRIVADKRKSGEIDTDLAELNVGAVLSALFALFDNRKPQQVDVLVVIDTPAGAVPWVRFSGTLSREAFGRIARSVDRPTTAWQLLGGRHGTCRAQRYSQAPLVAPVSPASVPDSLPTEKSGKEQSHLAKPVGLESSEMRRASTREISLGPSNQTVGGAGRVEKVPAPPEGTLRASGIPRQRELRNTPFGVLSQKLAAVEGSADARFVAFQTYWPTYASLDQSQLNFYFGWRTQVRLGHAPRTDLSYIFLYIYELLHLAGCKGVEDAVQRIERVWRAYRGTWPKLDGYVVPWVADLLALNEHAAAVPKWYRQVMELEASAGDAIGAAIIADAFWREADLRELPPSVVATLTGEARLGENKFCREHNENGWVDQGYREALVVAEARFAAATGKSLRNAALASANDHANLSRAPFQSAVYEWKRPTVVSFGVYPLFEQSKLVPTTFSSAVRYAENLMRKHRDFGGRLRGVDVDPMLAKALDEHFATWFRKSRPRAKVIIDLKRADALHQESAEVRSILAAGREMDMPADPPEIETPAQQAPAPTGGSSSWEQHPISELNAVPSGLLTDLIPLQGALARLPSTARDILRVFVTKAWEVAESDAALAAAAGGSLVAPFIDQINEAAAAAVGDILVAVEDGRYIIADDFRDEVHWIVEGNLERFVLTASPVPDHSTETTEPTEHPDIGHFGPVELSVLRVLLEEPDRTSAALTTLAAAHGTMPLLLLEQTNEAGLASSHGDLLIDTSATPPVLLADAITFAREIVVRMRSPSA